MVDHISKSNPLYNDYSMRNLLAEGVHPRFIQKTRSPIREIYEHYKDKNAASTAVADLGLSPGVFSLVSVHRQENVDLPEKLEKVIECLVVVREKLNMSVTVSTRPEPEFVLRLQERTLKA